jgi:transcriptional regulator with GAF, ATPase, and Fis domain
LPAQPNSGAEDVPETPEQRRQRVMAVLKKHGGNKAAAGRELGISAERVRQLVTPKKGASKDSFASHDPFNIRPGKSPRRS